MEKRSIVSIQQPEYLRLGGMTIAQALPNQEIEQADPFLLLHHAGPVMLKPEFANFYVGPHPHRGFEPITFLFQGGVRHKDSLGNDSSIQAPGVQWITASRGIIHSEQSSDAFKENGGNFELIQLWVNLPAAQKMIPPAYQKAETEELPLIEFNNPHAGRLYLVSGEQQGKKGPINSLTGIRSYMGFFEANETLDLNLNPDSTTLVYVLEGHITIGDQEVKNKELAILDQKGSQLNLESLKHSRVLILEGNPLEEEVVSWGPYVMNTQREIMEAMRDYNMGKMGFLAD